MSIFYKHGYTFKASDSNYIEAIAKFNSLDTVSAIKTKRIFKADITCAELPNFIANNLSEAEKANPIEIITDSYNSRSMATVFPPVAECMSLDKKAESASNIDNAIVKENAENLKWYIPAFADESGACPMQPDLQEMTQKQAFLVLKDIHNKLNLNGAIHIPSHQAIFMLYETHNYVLVYGKDTQIYAHTPLTFDVDDGFLCKEGHDKIVQTMIKELINLVKVWQKNNYQGPIITPEQAGFKLAASQTHYSTQKIGTLYQPQICVLNMKLAPGKLMPKNELSF